MKANLPLPEVANVARTFHPLLRDRVDHFGFIGATTCEPRSGSISTLRRPAWHVAAVRRDDGRVVHHIGTVCRHAAIGGRGLVQVGVIGAAGDQHHGQREPSKWRGDPHPRRIATFVARWGS